jgi:hypothetical protein
VTFQQKLEEIILGKARLERDAASELLRGAKFKADTAQMLHDATKQCIENQMAFPKLPGGQA